MCIAELVNGGSPLDVLIIDANRRSTVLKVSTEIRTCIIKQGRNCINLEALQVKDHFQPL